jgi:hypothetical protein
MTAFPQDERTNTSQALYPFALDFTVRRTQLIGGDNVREDRPGRSGWKAPSPSSTKFAPNLPVNPEIGHQDGGLQMYFKISGQNFNTQNMLTLDLDGHYLRLFLDIDSQTLFLQTFDLDHGIMIRAISVIAARELARGTKTPLLPDEMTFLEVLDRMGMRRIVGAEAAELEFGDLSKAVKAV